jgi:probable LLM family oxidoreductase
MADLLERARLADEVGLHYFGIGEHHRPDYAVSAPVPVLAAAAAQTKNIKVGSAVTVLSTEDPVRVYQQFATLDLLSGGRAELTAGRGSFIESYPLFGAALADYDELYEEKIALLLQLDEQEEVTWSGKFRPALDNARILPRPSGLPTGKRTGNPSGKPGAGQLDIWIATGGTPASTVRAATLGKNVMYALLGGTVHSFAQHAQLYRTEAAKAGHDVGRLKVGVSSTGLVARDDAADKFYPHWLDSLTRIAAERGFSKPSRVSYNMQAARSGGIYVGNPEEVAEKLVLTHQYMQHDRHILQMDLSSVPQKTVLESIELLGTEVLPLVQRELSPE